MFYKVLQDYQDGLINKKTVVLAVLGKIVSVLFWVVMLFFTSQTCVRTDELCIKIGEMLENQRRAEVEYQKMLRMQNSFEGGGNAYEN